jgi:hypothetical protein
MANMANTAAYRLADGSLTVDVDTAKTLTLADSGFLQNVIADAVVVSIPATATQGSWKIRAGGVKPSGTPTGAVSDGTMNLSISPVAADQIQGGVTGTAVDNKDIILTKTTMKVGDYATIVNTAETNGPLVYAISGIWTREA